MIHVVGAIGTILVLGAYFLVSTGRVTSSSLPFQGMNLGGAIALIWYSWALSAYSSVALNVVWAIIAIFALSRLRRRPTEPVKAEDA